jgi:hypothetical protein
MEADRPKRSREPEKAREGEEAAKVTERKSRMETGEGVMEASDAER